MKLKGDKVLEYFAEETGGRAFFPFKIQDVSDAFSQIQDELRSQYAISYKPADLQPNGKYHTIQILADNKKYKVRARKGYYAPVRSRIGNTYAAGGSRSTRLLLGAGNCPGLRHHRSERGVSSPGLALPS